MITGSDDSPPRYAYFRWLGRGFCSILGGCSIDGTGVLTPSPRDSKYFRLLCPKESIHLTYSWASSLRFPCSFSTRLVSKGSVRPLWLDTTASTNSAMKQVSLSAGCLTASKTLNFTSSSCTLSFSSPLCTSIIALPVAKKGLPRIIGISLSSSMSNTMKSAGKMNLSTFTKTSSITPLGCFNDLSASWRVTVVGRASPNPKRLNMDKGIRLMLAPKSHSALSKIAFPIVHGIVKLPGSLSFCGSFLCRMALHSSVKFTVSKSANLLF